MNFRNRRVELLWRFVNGSLQNNMAFFNLWVQKEFGEELVITSTVRLLAEQRQINIDRSKIDPTYTPVYPGPHPLGNAVDASHLTLSGREWTPEEIARMVERYNAEFPYAFENMKSCLYHNVAGFHLHFQINPRLAGTGINQNDPEQYRKLLEALRGL